MHTMLIRPTGGRAGGVRQAGLRHLQRRRVPGQPPDRRRRARRRASSLSLEDRELIILGTEYAGEMKKGVFTVANYFAPKRGLLSMHCSATADQQTGRSSLLFGLCGTGKTTLSADPKRAPDRRRRARLERRRHLQHRGRLLRQGDQPLARERAGHLPGPAVRGRAGERGARGRPQSSTSPTRASRRTRAARTRSSSSEREDPLRGRPPDRRHLPHLRRVRRAAAGQRAVARRRRCTTSSAATRRRSPAPRSA